MKQAKELAKYITGEKKTVDFFAEFNGQYSNNFDPAKDLKRIGVVNQTTMLASDTQAIADFLKQTMMLLIPCIKISLHRPRQPNRVYGGIG